MLQQIVDALADSIATMFSWATIPVIIAIVLIFFMGPARLTDQFTATKKAQ